MSERRHVIGTLANITTLANSGWDLIRTVKPRIANADAQVYLGSGPHCPKPLSVAVRLGLVRKHPTQNLWALLVDKPGDADLTGVLTELEARPAVRSLLDNGGTMVLPDGQTWPDGSTEPRPNYFDAGSPAATQARYLAMRRLVLPTAWSNVTAYAVGDTCWRSLNGTPVGFRCLVANTNSQPTLANGNWSAYLGPLPASWTPTPGPIA
jgi:hypothetical protein